MNTLSRRIEKLEKTSVNNTPTISKEEMKEAERRVTEIIDGATREKASGVEGEYMAAVRGYLDMVRQSGTKPS